MSEEFVHVLNNPRNVLRRKVVALLDLFDVDGFERSIALSRFEKGLRETTDDKLQRALRILRE